MSMKAIRRTILVSFTVLAACVLVGGVLLRYWINPVVEHRAEKKKAPGLVDDQPLLTAQKLAAMAAPEEQEFAKNALRLADHEVDMAFAAALHQVTEHAPPVPASAKPLLANMQAADRRVKSDQQEMARLKQQLAKAEESAKLAIQDRLDLLQATLEVDQEDFDALHEELIRAGGDPRSKIQQLKEQHEALDHEQTGVTPAQGKGEAPAGAAQEGQSRVLIVQFRAWRQLSDKEKELAAAREELKGRLAGINREHQQIDEETRDAASEEHHDDHGPAAATQSSGSPAIEGSEKQQKFAALKHTASERKHLAELDKRASDFQQLDAIYSDWAALVAGREHVYSLGLLEGLAWVVVLLLVLIFRSEEHT